MTINGNDNEEDYLSDIDDEDIKEDDWLFNFVDNLFEYRIL